MVQTLTAMLVFAASAIVAAFVFSPTDAEMIVRFVVQTTGFNPMLTLVMTPVVAGCIAIAGTCIFCWQIYRLVARYGAR